MKFFSFISWFDESVTVWNSCKRAHDRNKQFEACAKEEEANRGRHPKRWTRESLIKLKFFNCNFISCDFQIIDNLFTTKCFHKVFLL